MGERQRVSVQRPAHGRAPAPAARATQAAEPARTQGRDLDGPALRRMMAAGALQPRLTIGAANDPYEREAERTADAIVSPDTGPQGSDGGLRRTGFAAGLTRMVRRALGKVDPVARKDDEKRRDEDDRRKVVQKKAAGRDVSDAPAEVESSIDVLSARGGSPLPPSLRSRFEPRFGYDFAGVRIHTEARAAGAAAALGARAFTVGDHVFFAAGEYHPTSTEGQRLIAHELTHVVQQGADPQRIRRRAVESWQIGGTTFFRTRGGDVVELPDDMTVEQVARLEDEALAAERKLVQLPKPRPVPEVRKPAPKPAKTPPPKPAARAKRAVKRPSAPKAADAAAAMLKAVGGGAVARYLVGKGAPVLVRGMARLSRLKINERTHEDSGEKLRKSEDAVKIPASEEQAAGNVGQVGAVADRPVPVVDVNQGKRTLEASLAANVPRSVGALDNFRRDKKAQHTGADVLEVVQGDTNEVVATFGDVRSTPPPVPSEHQPVELPPAEAAPATPTMHLGTGAIAPLEKEHTDVSAYTKEADSRLKEEGVTQEQLDMVDSGDLAEANKEKKGLAKAAATEPLAVRELASEERRRVDKELAAEERTERGVLGARRKSALAATGIKQKDTRTALEKKRDAVALEINGRYKAAQVKVEARLGKLDAESMKKFDDGNTAAAKAFEDDVNRELEAYKDDRYSGWFGWARKAKDWLLGMDELPDVKAIFERNREAFVTRIGTLVEDISAENARVIQECKDELTATRTKIDEYVAELDPALRDVGQKAAGEMHEKLDLLDKQIGAKEEELKNKLKDKQAAAIRAIDEKIEKMKESMSGALAKLGRLLLLAAKKFFTWTLEKFGVSLSTIESIIDKGVAVLKAIFTAPIRFVKNLVGAAKKGFSNFALRFVTHLKDALFAWLTGALTGITLPETWNARGVTSVIFQVVGIGWANLKERLVLLIPRPVVEQLQTTFGLVKTLVVEGPIAAWEEIKDMGEELKKTFITSLTDWLKVKVVQEAVKTILAFFIPGAGIIRAVMAIYDTIVFFIQKAKDIIQMIGSFLGSIAEIAAGNIAAAADALENGLARGLKLVIAFLAKFLRLEGITAHVRTALDKVRGKVNAVLDKVARWVVKQAKAVIGSVKSAAGKLLAWWKAKEPFRTAGGEEHEVGFSGEDASAELSVYSTPQKMSAYLSAWATAIAGITNDATKSKQEKALSRAKAKWAVVKSLQAELAVRGKKGEDDPARQKKADDLTKELRALATILALQDAGQKLPLPPAVFPPFVNGVLASGFKASFLSKAVLGSGTEPSTAQQPKSWDIVQKYKLSAGARWVRMHLLTAQLGGKAADSNLVPARGPETNFRFRDEVEHPAKNALTAPGTDRETMIWYDVKVDFHATSDTHGPGFPSHIGVRWGGYEEQGGAWKEKPASKARSFAQPSSLPELNTKSAVLMINLEGRGRVSTVLDISEGKARKIIDIREAAKGFDTADSLIKRVATYDENLSIAVARKVKNARLVTFARDP